MLIFVALVLACLAWWSTWRVEPRRKRQPGAPPPRKDADGADGAAATTPLPAGAARDEAAFMAAAKACGLERDAEELWANARPALHLQAVAGPPVALGGSKMGSAPHVPAGFVWPTYKKKSQDFIGQLNLAELAEWRAITGLPASGVLSFFYHVQQEVWGGDPSDRGSWQVYYWPATTALAPCPMPPDLAEAGTSSERALTSTPILTLPDGQTARELGLIESDADADAYTKLDEWCRGPHEVQHQVAGWPQVIQNPMEEECALVAHGLGYSTDRHSPAAQVALAEAADWRLLVQVDSDDIMYGDCGMLYFWIRQQDLARQDFSQMWCILQCT